MAISISDYLKIKKNDFKKTEAFDAILGVDSKYFIDPLLLKHCKVPEFSGSYNKVENHFNNILKVLKNVKNTNKKDLFWRKAIQMFQFHEIRGLCIGYSSKSTYGNGIGPELINNLLNTAKAIIDAGIKDPEIFEIVGLFEDKIGPDRISDMISRIIYEDILNYSEKITAKLEIKKNIIKIVFNSKTYKLVINPFNKSPILFLPKSILKDLPLSDSWEDIADVCDKNREVREVMNNTIGDNWKNIIKSQGTKKSDLKDLFLKYPDLLREFIKEYKNKIPSEYDFNSDPSGEWIWYPVSKLYVQENPISLNKPSNYNKTEIAGIVKKISLKYKDLIENNDLSSLLYDNHKKPKHESASQKLFYGIADAYCEANNIDINRETNSGRGPVDFKFSKGYQGRFLVEIKLSTNKKLIQGFETQLLEYQKAEKTKDSLYLIIKVSNSTSLLDRFIKLIESKKKENLRIPEIIIIDGIPKDSASKYRPRK